jgi:archaellin
MAMKRGLLGIEMLILFIAVIVVSAVSAAVLIGATGSLEQRSVATVKGTEAEVASGITIYSIVGSDGSVDGTINNLEMLIRIKPGSDPINLNTTLLTIDTRTQFQNLVYDATGLGSATQSGTYAVYYLRRGGSASLPGYVAVGDSAVINVTLENHIGHDERVIIQLLPAQGNVKRLGFTTPSVMIDKRVFLFP